MTIVDRDNKIKISDSMYSDTLLINNIDTDVIPIRQQITEDVNGRYLNLDVIAMKCPKSKYFAALKASFLRAVNTVNSLSSKKAAKNQAMTQLMKDAGAGVAEEFESGKVGFYDASGIEI